MFHKHFNSRFCGLYSNLLEFLSKIKITFLHFFTLLLVSKHNKNMLGLSSEPYSSHSTWTFMLIIISFERLNVYVLVCFVRVGCEGVLLDPESVDRERDIQRALGTVLERSYFRIDQLLQTLAYFLLNYMLM